MNCELNYINMYRMRKVAFHSLFRFYKRSFKFLNLFNLIFYYLDELDDKKNKQLD